MHLVKDCDLEVLCSFPFRVREFIEHYRIFCLIECTSVDPAVGNLAVRQMMTVIWGAPG